jgi:FtsZ-interacting cell division protein YlmF
MVKNLFKKLGREQEPEELDTGYDSGYYGGQTKEDETRAAEHRSAARGYEEPEYRSDRTYAAPHSADTEYRQPERANGYYEEEPYSSRAERSYVQTGRYAVSSAPVNKGTVYFRPEFYSDKRDEMVDGLSEGHVVMISTNYLESVDRMRLVDYLMGAVRALKGEVNYRNGILALTPKGVELDEADYELLEEQEAAVDEVADWDEESDGEYASETDMEYDTAAYEAEEN